MALQTDLISNCSSVTVTVTDTLAGASTSDQLRITNYATGISVSQSVSSFFSVLYF